MSNRQSKKRSHVISVQSAATDVFAEYGLNRVDFVVSSGGGKSFISKQRIVWMSVTHKATGQKVSGKIGTVKKRAEEGRDDLLRILLRSFRRS